MLLNLRLNMAKIFILLCFFTLNLKAENLTVNLNPNSCNKHEFRKLLLKIYDIYLCKDSDNIKLNYHNIYQHNFSLMIHYNLDIKKTKLIASTIDEISRYHQLNLEEIQYFQDKLTEIYPNISKGDVLAAKYSLNQNLVFYHNNKFQGQITIKDKIIKFLDIWLFKPNYYPKMQQDLVN